MLFSEAAGVQMEHVPYRGTAPALLDVVAGHVDAMFAPLDVALPLIREGRVRALAVTGEAPVPSLPDVPVLRSQAPEVGTAAAWFGVLGPAGMPAPVVSALHEALTAATAAPRFRERVATGGGESPALTPSGFRDFLLRDTAMWIETARLGGIRPE